MKKIIICLSLALISAMTVFGQNAMEQFQKTAELFVTAYNEKNYGQIEQ